MTACTFPPDKASLRESLPADSPSPCSPGEIFKVHRSPPNFAPTLGGTRSVCTRNFVKISCLGAEIPYPLGRVITTPGRGLIPYLFSIQLPFSALPMKIFKVLRSSPNFNTGMTSPRVGSTPNFVPISQPGAEISYPLGRVSSPRQGAPLLGSVHTESPSMGLPSKNFKLGQSSPNFNWGLRASRWAHKTSFDPLCRQGADLAYPLARTTSPRQRGMFWAQLSHQRPGRLLSRWKFSKLSNLHQILYEGLGDNVGPRKRILGLKSDQGLSQHTPSPRCACARKRLRLGRG